MWPWPVIYQTGDELQEQDTQANKRSPQVYSTVKCQKLEPGVLKLVRGLYRQCGSGGILNWFGGSAAGVLASNGASRARDNGSGEREREGGREGEREGRREGEREGGREGE